MNAHFNGVAEPAKWGYVSSILETTEQGASRHCLALHYDGAGKLLRAAHHRLHVSITFAD
jgi:hypothetical protein